MLPGSAYACRLLESSACESGDCAPNLGLQKTIWQAFSFEISGDTESICCMRLHNLVLDTLVLRNVTERHVNILIELLQTLIESPSHDSHECCIAETHTTANRLRQFYCAFMIACMTGLAKRDQIIWRITASLSTLDVVHVKDFIFRLAMAALAGMSIAEQDVFTDIPKTELFSLLILYTSNIWVLNLLDVEAGRFNGDAENWQHPAYIRDNTEMSGNLVLDTWC